MGRDLFSKDEVSLEDIASKIQVNVPAPVVNVQPAQVTMPEQMKTVPKTPESMDVTSTFDPMYYYTSKQGGTRGFSIGTDVVSAPTGTDLVIMVMENPVGSNVNLRNWRTTVSSNVDGVFRRWRLTNYAIKAGATPYPIVNRGGGTNTSKARAWRGSDVTITTKTLVRAEFLTANTPYEVRVEGSIVIPPGRATAYAFESSGGLKAPQATVEYVWWEDPV